MADVAGVADLMVEQQADIPFVHVDIDRDAIARHGLRVRDVASAIETAFTAARVSRVLEGQRTSIWCCVIRSSRVMICEASARPCTTAAGARLPCTRWRSAPRPRAEPSAARTFSARSWSPQRRRRRRSASMVDAIRARGERVALPSGYRIAYGGQFESAEQAGRPLLLLGVGVIAGIFCCYIAFARPATRPWSCSTCRWR